MKKVCLSTLLAFFLSSLCVAYENDGPGYDPNTPKKVRLMSSSNSFKPPEPSDICFVATSGGDLGKEVWGPRGFITIPLPIDRYFGDKAKLLQSKALPETVTLKMVVWDVDDKSSYTPAEYDEIFVNDNAPIDKKALYGVNNGLQLNTFTIDTKHIKLPKNPGETAMNTIRIDVATKGGDWVTRIDWVALEIPAAPPIILSHGINSSADQLKALQRKIKDETGLPCAAFDYPNHGNNHISDIVALSRKISDMKDEWHVDHVNIVAHSMGGLRAREYAENANDVFKVLQIATPNAGSPVADFVIGWKEYVEAGLKQDLEDGYIDEYEYGRHLEKAKKHVLNVAKDIAQMELDPWGDPAVFCLQTSQMAIFNKNNRLNDKVEYGVVAGQVTKYDSLTSSVFGYALFSKKEDLKKAISDALDTYFVMKEHDITGVVGLGSAGYSKAYLQDNLQDILLNTFKEPTDLVVPVWSAHSKAAKISPLNGSPIKDKQGKAWHSGLILDGVSQTVEVLKPKLIEKKMADYGKGASSSTQSALRGGKMSSVVRTLGSENNDSADDMKVGVLYSETEKGVDFGIVNNSHAIVALNVSVDGIKSTKFKLISPSGKEYVDCDEDVMITNSVSNVIILLGKPEKGKWRLEWTSEWEDTDDVGIWTLAVLQVDDGVSFSPQLENSSVAIGDTFTLSVSPKVGDEAVSGTVRVVATAPNGSSAIYDAVQNGGGVFSAQIPATEEGHYTFAVTLDATSPSAFSRSGILSGVVHSGGAGFLQSNSAVVRDVDGNGLYDNLTVNFAVNATKAGTYRVLATLADSDGNEIAEGWTSNVVCSAGTQTFPVAFDGRAIYGNGECGGYQVSSAKLLEIGEDYEAVVDERSDLFTTTAYTYQQFEHDLVAMKSGGSDSAVDVNSDGTYDRLDVTIPLYADDLAAGSYEWSASLMDADGFLLGTASGYVTFVSGQGGASISMSFDRDGIVATHKNGMYHVKNLIIWGNGRNLTIAGEYTTASYNIEDFGGELATVDLGFFLPSGWSDPLIISTNATAMTSQTVFEQGDPIYLNYAFKNVANQAAVSNFVNRFTLSNGSSYSDSWIGYGLKEGGWGWLGESFAPTMLQNLPAGTYTLTCELDVEGQLPETDEFNNAIDMTFTIKESLRPNLMISSASVSRDSFTVSDSVVFHWRVENMGRVAATKTKTAFRIWKYDSSSEEWMLKDTEYLDCISLATGGGREFTRTISGKTFGTGEFAIGLCADGKGSLVELNESDNNEFVYFTVSNDNATSSKSNVDWQFNKIKGEADSFFLSASSDMKKKATTFKVGQPIYMRCCWWNAKKGAVSGNAMRVRVVMNGSSGVYADRSYFEKDYYYYFSSKTPDFLQNLPAGNYTLTAVLDSENTWVESNEKNNVKTISFTVVGTPKIFCEAIYHCALNEPVSWPVTIDGKATLTGLPSGLKYSDGAITGKATKTGTYTVSISTKNEAGTATKSITIRVEDPGFIVSCSAQPNGSSVVSNMESGGTVEMYAGVNQVIMLSSIPGKADVASADATVTAKGLPAGLKLSGGKITGVPTKAGTYAVNVSFKNKLSWTSSFLLNIVVHPLPAWAVGNFEGFVSLDENDGGFATMSVTAAGKVSGKIAYGGTNWTFKADSFAVASETVGYTNLAIRTVATSGKATLDLSLNMVDFLVDSLPSSTTSFAEGYFGEIYTMMYRLPWKDKGDVGAAALIASYAGAYSCSVPYGDDSGDVTFVLDEKGVVKGTVILPDGAKARKATFSCNVLPNYDSLSVVIALPPDAKKGYPAVFKVVNLVNHSGAGADDLAFRDPGVVAAVAELTAESGATGTVSVNPKYGQVAPGKDVTLTAKAAKGSVFHRWEITGVDTEGLDLSSATLKFKMTDTGDVFAKAVFVTAEEDAASIALSVDALGGEITPEAIISVTNTCGVALKWSVAADAFSKPVVAVTGLPSGLKFTAKDIMKKGSKTEIDIPANTIYGAPTAESKLNAKTGLRKPSVVKFTVTTAGKSKRVYSVDMTVLPLPAWAVGTFNGGGDYGQVSLTVAKTGKLSGKYLSEGLTWTLAADSFDSIDESGDVYRATLIGKSGKLVMTNEIGVAGNAIGGYAESVDYIAYQNNWKLEPWKSVGKPFAKATALEYEDSASVAGVPVPGVLTLKFAASGAVTVKGSFVTGVNERTGKDILYTASGSAVLAPQIEPDEIGAFDAVVFVYLPPKAGKFDGYVRCIDVRWTGDGWIKQ